MPQVKIVNMKIEALLFDLGKVIIDFSMDSMLQELCASCSQPATEFERVLQDPDLVRRYESGQITTRQFYEHLCDLGGLQLNFARFSQLWSSVFADLLISEELLRELRRRYPLILVSNTNESHAKHLSDRYPVLDYFDEKIFSFQVGAMKPDPRIYEFAIAASGRRAEALFFTDDREENVQGARKLGIHAHQFRSEDRLVAALQDAGVEVGSFVRRQS